MAKDLEFSAKSVDEVSTPVRKDEVVQKLIAAWNSNNAKSAKRVGTFGFMAVALAACGGGSDNGNGSGDANLILRRLSGSAESLGIQTLALDPAAVIADVLATAKDGILGLERVPLLPGAPDAPIDASRGLVVPAGVTYVGDISLFSAAGEGISVTGEGNLWLLVSDSGFVANEQSVSLNVNLTGGTLVIDMGSDQHQLFVGGNINLNGGTLVVSDGNLIVSVAEFQDWGVGKLVLNSSLILDFRGTDLQSEEIGSLLAGIDASGAGELRVLVDDDEQARLVFDGLLQNISLLSGSAPGIVIVGSNGTSVDVDLQAIIDSKIAYLVQSIQIEIDDLEQKIQGGGVDAEDFTSLAALKTLIDDLSEASGTASDDITTLELEIGAPNTAVAPALSNATGLYALIESSIKTAVDALQAQITSNDGDIAALINDGQGTFGQPGYVAPTTNSIAGLKAALTALSTTAGSDVDALELEIGAPNTAVAPALSNATGLYALIESSIKTAVDALQAQITSNEGDIAALISDGQGTFGQPGYVAPTTNSIAGLQAALTALETLTSSGEGSIGATLVSLQSQIMDILDLLNAQPLDWSEFVGPNAENAFTVADIFGTPGVNGSSTVLNSFMGSFADRIDGYSPATVPLVVTGDLTVAQAVALAEAGLGVNTGNVTYSIRDAYTTVQSALTNPDANAAMAGATEVVAFGNSNPNQIDMMAFGPLINLRVESGSGDDTISTGSGDHTIFAARGADTMWLTPTEDDISADTVVYQTIFDGEHLPVTSLTFSNDADDYREGSTLSVRVNGVIYTYTTVAVDTMDMALQGFASAIGASSAVGGVSVNGNILQILGASTATRLSVVTDFGTPDSIVDLVNAGQVTQWKVEFSSLVADYPDNVSLGGTFQFDRKVYITIAGTEVSADIVYTTPDVADPAATVAALKAAIEAEMAVGQPLADVLGAVTIETNGSALVRLVLEGKTVPATDGDAPTFSVTDAAIDVVGEQQQTTVSFSSVNADYYIGGEMSVTIAGVAVTANMFESNADLSVAAMKTALDLAAVNTPAVAAVLETTTRVGTTLTLTAVTEATDPILAAATQTYEGELQQATILLEDAAYYDVRATDTLLDREADVLFNGGRVYATIKGTGTDGLLGTADDVIHTISADMAGEVQGFDISIPDDWTRDTVLSAPGPEGSVSSMEVVFGNQWVGMTLGSISTQDGQTFGQFLDAFALKAGISAVEFTPGAGVHPGSLVVVPTSTGVGLEWSGSFGHFINGVALNVYAPAQFGPWSADLEPVPATAVSDTLAVAKALANAINDAAAANGELDGVVSEASVDLATGKITLTAANPGKETFEITDVRLDYEGVVQMATFELDDSAAYSNYTYDLDGNVTPDRTADVLFEGGKAYVTITGAGTDGLLDTVDDVVHTVSADMAVDARGIRIAVPTDWTTDTAVALSSGNWLLFELRAGDYATTIQTARTADGETFGEFLARAALMPELASVAFLPGDGVSAAGYLVLEPAANSGVAAAARVIGNSGGSNSAIVALVVTDGATDTNLALAAAINDAAAAGGALEGVIGNAFVDTATGQIVLEAKNAGESTFEISDVRLDYQGVKQIATVTLDTATTYDEYSFTDAGAPVTIHASGQPAVYFENGQARISVTGVGLDGQMGTSDDVAVSITATMGLDAMSTAQNLVDAINLETGPMGQLVGMVGLATRDGSTITLESEQFGVESFAVSDITLDYQGVKQIAQVDFTTAANSDPIAYFDGGALSVSIVERVMTQGIHGIHIGAVGGDGTTVYQTVEFRQGADLYRVQFMGADLAGNPTPSAWYDFQSAAKQVGGTWQLYTGADSTGMLTALAADLGASSVTFDYAVDTIAGVGGVYANLMFIGADVAITDVYQVKFAYDGSPGVSLEGNAFNDDISLTAGEASAARPTPSISVNIDDGTPIVISALMVDGADGDALPDAQGSLDALVAAIQLEIDGSGSGPTMVAVGGDILPEDQLGTDDGGVPVGNFVIKFFHDADGNASTTGDRTEYTAIAATATIGNADTGFFVANYFRVSITSSATVTPPNSTVLAQTDWVPGTSTIQDLATWLTDLTNPSGGADLLPVGFAVFGGQLMMGARTIGATAIGLQIVTDVLGEVGITNLPGDGYAVAVSVGDGRLNGIVGSVSVIDGVITLTSADTVREQFVVSDATATEEGKPEIVDVTFSTVAADYFAAANDSAASAGTVSVTVMGDTYTANMVDGNPIATAQALLAVVQAGIDPTEVSVSLNVAYTETGAASYIGGYTVESELQGVTMNFDLATFATNMETSGGFAVTDSVLNGVVFSTSERYFDFADWAADAQTFWRLTYPTVTLTFNPAFASSNGFDNTPGTPDDGLTGQLVVANVGTAISSFASMAMKFVAVDVTDVTFTFTGAVNGTPLEAAATHAIDGVIQVSTVTITDDPDGRPINLSVDGSNFLSTKQTQADVLVDLKAQLDQYVIDNPTDNISLSLDTVSIVNGELVLTLKDSDKSLDVHNLERDPIVANSVNNVPQEVNLFFTQAFLNSITAGVTLKIELGPDNVVTLNGPVTMTDVANALAANAWVDTATKITGANLITITAQNFGDATLGTVSDTGTFRVLRDGVDVTTDTLDVAVEQTVTGNIETDPNGTKDTVGSTTTISNVLIDLDAALDALDVAVTQDGVVDGSLAVDFTNPGFGPGDNSGFFGDAPQLTTDPVPDGITQSFQNPDNGYTADTGSALEGTVDVNDKDLTFYGDDPLTGVIDNAGVFNSDGIKQTYTNPDDGYHQDAGDAQGWTNPNNLPLGDQGFLGDDALSGAIDGSEGVKQTYTNPDNGYTAINNSPEEDLIDPGTGDTTLFGSDAGFYDKDGLLTTYLNGQDPTVTDVDGDMDRYVNDVIGIDDTVNAGAADDTESLAAGAIEKVRDGFAGFDWDSAITTLLTRGNAGPDVIHNFQVGHDSIGLEAALASSTFAGEDATDIARISSDEVTLTPTRNGTSFNDVIGFNNVAQLEGVAWNFVHGDADLPFTFESGYIQQTLLIRDTNNNNVGQINFLVNFNNTTYNSIADFMVAVNATKTITSGGGNALVEQAFLLDLTAALENNLLSIPAPTVVGATIGFLNGFPETSFLATLLGNTEALPEFDLSLDEFGLVASADSTLAASAVSDEVDVAALLNNLFDFSATSANGVNNTTVFAVTASDDPNVTAIWAHLQSSDDDNTIDANELSLLAVVNTIDGEFGLSNFDDILYTPV